MPKILASLLVLVALACASAQQDSPQNTLWQGLLDNPEFSTLVSLLEQTGMAEQLQGAGEYTLFAPRNAAFENLGQGTLDRLGGDEELLRNVLGLHVLEGRYNVIDLRDAGGTLMSADGSPYEIDLTAGGLTVNRVGLDSTNVDNDYANGVLHVVNDVIVPVALRDEIEQARAAAAGTPATTAPGAVAPGAVAPGTAAPGTAAPGTAAPGAVAPAGAAAVGTMTDMSTMTMLEYLQNDGRFTMLIDAATQAGLGETLNTGGPLTLFAPTDAAFDALTEEQRNQYLNDPQALDQLLRYHVLEGEWEQNQLVGADMTEGDPRPTLFGTDLRLMRTDGALMLNDTVRVDEPDVRVSNGLVHVINQVLVPGATP